MQLYWQNLLYVQFSFSTVFFQAWYLLKAELWNEAHKVIVEKIAPDAIINDDYEFFFSLLQDLANLGDTSTKVFNWQTQGQVFYDFITVDLKLRELLQKRDEEHLSYEIQTLRPKVLSLCQRVNSLSVKTAKERLCQSEIAKKNGLFNPSHFEFTRWTSKPDGNFDTKSVAVAASRRLHVTGVTDLESDSHERTSTRRTWRPMIKCDFLHFWKNIEKKIIVEHFLCE